jgi:hypothetical protein
MRAKEKATTRGISFRSGLEEKAILRAAELDMKISGYVNRLIVADLEFKILGAAKNNIPKKAL